LHQIVQPSSTAITQKKTSYDFSYAYAPSGPTSLRPHAPAHIGERTYGYDANGNQTGWTHDQNGTRRTIVWDDENRIQSILDNGHEKTYKYDDGGNRVIKRGPQGETVYVNQFFTDRPGSNGTKHVYAGTSRIASKLMRQDGPASNPSGKAPFEKDLYFYHPDHLGSSNFITDLNGKLYEHLEYFPFGESWVEENSNVQRTPYLFTAKELDEETGLYYYGARYYDPRTSVWQSADPILGRYLGGRPGGGVYSPATLSLYSYGGNNPVTFLDPDGRFKIPIHKRIVDNAASSVGKFSALAMVDLRSGATNIADVAGYFSDYHFDGRAGFSEIQATWGKLNASIKENVSQIGAMNKALGGADVVGLGVDLHTVADFYSHSNYVELYIEYYQAKNKGAMPQDVPIYDEGIKDKGFRSLLEQRLKTGEFNLLDNEFYDLNPIGADRTGSGSHAQMNKDRADTPAGRLAEKAATKHTEKILRTVE
jgi:RHS repeat-associated protein